jgi:hypothetical protein
LLPEAQAVYPSRVTDAVFVVALITTTIARMTFLGG